MNDNTQLVAGSSRLLTQMAATSDGIYRSSESVASAAQNASTMVNNISQSAERMSGAVGMVASAIEQMNSTLHASARNCQQECRTGVKANAQARTTEVMITRLDVAAGGLTQESSNIQKVTRGVGEVSAGINEPSQGARPLVQYVEKLKKIINLCKT